jgi:hypothetical protein
MSADPKFAQLREQYEAALAAECAHDAVAMPAPTFRYVSPKAEAESERLADVRYQIEDELMDIPSATLTEFAFKYLVAHGDGRDTDCWNGMLEEEAKRFANAAIDRGAAS